MEEPQQGKSAGKRALVALRWVLFLGCLALFVRALAHADLRLAWGHIRGMGPLAVLVLPWFPTALAFDAWAWKVLLGGIGRPVKVRTLFEIRLATEAVSNSIPVGLVWAEALAPILVSRRAGTPPEDVFAASTAKRWTVVRGHATYVALASLAGLGVLLRASRGLFGSSLLVYLCFGSAAGLALFSIGFEALAARGQVAGRVSGLLGRTRLVRIRAWVEARRHGFARADVQLAALSKSPKVETAAAWRLFFLWFFEGVETVVILKLLGVPLGIFEMFALDAALSVVRSAAIFAPSGIGVQDVGWLALLEGAGVPGAAEIGPAFVVLKRVKEALWLAIGFGVLAKLGSKRVMQEAKEVAAASG
ncbi:MAG: hypothetical protein JWP97_133 [Labilithrix sp.]|nr:hypothetical protein [Labilithrix sp.]